MTADRIGTLALEAILLEAITTPKPGLVDCRNNGSHADMTLATFLRSAAALGRSFDRFAQIGIETREMEPVEVFPLLQQAGLEAEGRMFAATDGVNTHKGMIFSMGLVCAAAGRLPAGWEPDRVCETVASFCEGLCARTLGRGGVPQTQGEKIYSEYRLCGVRGEAEAGYPTVREALPLLKDRLARGYTPNDARVDTLLFLVTRLEDTNVLGRGGMEAAAWAKKMAAEFLERGGIGMPGGWQRAEALDDAFIARWISPGGAADLLAVTWMLHRLSEAEES